MTEPQLLDVTDAADWWPEVQELLLAGGSRLLVRELAERCRRERGELLIGRVGRRVVGAAALIPHDVRARAELAGLSIRRDEAGFNFVHAVTWQAARQGAVEVQTEAPETGPVAEALLHNGYAVNGESDTHARYRWTVLPRAREVLRDNVMRLGKGDWALVVHNDDDTPMDFVTSCLSGVCGHKAELAWALMVCVHYEGRAVVALRRKAEDAEELADLVRIAAMRDSFPLRTTVERLPD